MGHVLRGRWRGALVLAAIVASGGAARAQGQGAAPPDSASAAKVAAEALFEEGRKLVAEGKIDEACPKFADSQRLNPSPGTLLNLASCYEKSGRTATAWATYREAASTASATNRQDLLATAQRHADALFPTLSKLTVTASSPPDGFVVMLDGVQVGRAEWGVALPADPGNHTIEASAPHFKTWSTKVTVPASSGAMTVTLPALEPMPEVPPAAVAPPPGPPPPPSPSEAPPESGAASSDHGSTYWNGQRIAGVVVGGVGVVGVGLGVVFAASAKSQYDDSLSNCETGAPESLQPGGRRQAQRRAQRGQRRDRRAHRRRRRGRRRRRALSHRAERARARRVVGVGRDRPDARRRRAEGNMVKLGRGAAIGASAVVVAALAALGAIACNGVLGIDSATLDPSYGRDAAPAPDAGLEAGSPCEAYCQAVVTNCPNEEYNDVPTCLALCGAFDLGQSTDTSQDSLGCRAHYAALAATDSSNCRAAGPLGGGVCGSDLCTTFCTLDTFACTGDNAVFDGGALGCEAACNADFDTYLADAGSDLALSTGNTLNCRIWHLEAAVASDTELAHHCPHTATISTFCHN